LKSDVWFKKAEVVGVSGLLMLRQMQPIDPVFTVRSTLGE